MVICMWFSSSLKCTIEVDKVRYVDINCKRSCVDNNRLCLLQ